MCPSRFALLLVFALASQYTFARQTPSPPTVPPPQRNTQAVTIVQQSVTAMAATVPSDSSATGTVKVVEGSTNQSGSIQILTLGTSNTSETLTLPGTQRVVIYSNGTAEETNGTQSTNPPMETVVTDQCPDFPLPLLLSALNNPDESLSYIGQETLNGESVQHVQVWDSFTSQPYLQKLAPFSQEDIWFDSSSGLPVKLSYFRRAGGGSVPSIPVAVFFSNYTNINGVLYPFQINKSFNGTPSQTITIQNVTFNNGLTAAQFPVE